MAKTEQIQTTDNIPLKVETIDIRSQIHIVRGKQVMLDSDLAMLYKVETGALNRAVKRNKKRFPEDFCFQLSEEEFLRCQNGISKDNDPDGRGGRRYMPYAFTEQKIFFDGQIYDAFSLITTIIQKAKSDIVLIDGYVDVNTLNILAKKNTGVDVTIFTYASAPLTKKDVENFNAQYPTLTVKKTQVFHDRFIILDGKTVYHIGASIKDAGKKCFGISLINDSSIVLGILNRLKTI